MFIIVYYCVILLVSRMRTIQQIKDEFAELGLSVSGWAKQRGYSQALVYQVLSGNRKALRGESHKIAVELGLKDGKSGCYEDLSFCKKGGDSMN